VSESLQETTGVPVKELSTDYSSTDRNRDIYQPLNVKIGISTPRNFTLPYSTLFSSLATMLSVMRQTHLAVVGMDGFCGCLGDGDDDHPSFKAGRQPRLSDFGRYEPHLPEPNQ